MFNHFINFTTNTKRTPIKNYLTKSVNIKQNFRFPCWFCGPVDKRQLTVCPLFPGETYSGQTQTNQHTKRNVGTKSGDRTLK